MKSFRVDVFAPDAPGAKLRLFGPEGRVIYERPWLLLRVTKSVKDSVTVTAVLLSRLDADSEAGPLLAAAALHFARTRGEKDPKREEMQELASRMAAACAAARNIEPERFDAWVNEELLDPRVWLPKLEAA